MPFLPRSLRTEDLVVSIISRRDELGLKNPWSVAELALDADDYAQLNRWAEVLEGTTVLEWARAGFFYADPVTLRRPRWACLGLLLLAVAAEAARREATEATLWPYVRNRSDGELRFPEADSVLFVQGQDKSAQEFRNAIEAAVREFGLRHVVDQTDRQRYYLTIFLQCGFPIRDARRVLGAWLGGQNRPVALQLLLDRQGPLGSESFASLWRDLRHARGGLIVQEAIRRKLEKSPWVLTDWTDDLIRALGVPSGQSGPGSPSFQTDDLAEALGRPYLRWPGGEPPRFECKLQGLATLQLPGRDYSLRSSGRLIARVEWDGSKLVASRPTIGIPGFPATAVIEWRDEDSGVSESVAVECFDPIQPATVYDLNSGQLVPPSVPLKSQGHYVLIHAADLTLHPEPTDWKQLKSGPIDLRVAAIPGDPKLAKLTTPDGATVWEASAPATSAIPPAWASATLRLHGPARHRSIAVGDRYHVAITHRPGVRVAFVRLGMEPLEPHPDPVTPGVTRVGPIVTSPATIGRQLRWLVGLEYDGMIARVTPTFDPERHGGALLRGEAWEVLDASNVLDAADARNSPILILVPGTWSGRQVDDSRETWAVMEGEVWVDSARERPRAIPRLAGLGGRLTVRLGPFNATSAQPPDGGSPRLDALILADRVVDRGVVRGAQPVGDAEGCSAWRIDLTHDIEVTPEHAILWWDRSGEVHTLQLEPWSDGEVTRSDWWMATPPASATEPRALMLTYYGRRLGGWWSSSWASSLASLADERGATTVADLLRDFRLPVLEEGSLVEVRQLAARHPGALLRSWLAATTPADWRVAARGAFRDWEPRSEQLDDMADLEAGGEIASPIAVPLKLMDVCPILMGRYLKVRLAGQAPAIRRWVLDEVRKRVEKFLQFEVCHLVGSDDSMLDGIKRATKLDPGFLQGLNRAGISAVLGLVAGDEYDQRANLDLAVLHFAACRYLLTLDILQSVEKGEISFWKGKTCAAA